MSLPLRMEVLFGAPFGVPVRHRERFLAQETAQQRSHMHRLGMVGASGALGLDHLDLNRCCVLELVGSKTCNGNEDDATVPKGRRCERRIPCMPEAAAPRLPTWECTNALQPIRGKGHKSILVTSWNLTVYSILEVMVLKIITNSIRIIQGKAQ